ncbi:MAG: group II intron maturase-specific domain-containing protein, partial [Sphaerochaetaceae bacterium]|nr:group II intron maturase-specific domain-containing protein [Sphaerochaetaceae bacterium]
ERVITELNSLLRGWINYYARSSIKMKLRDIMEWTRRRVRQYAYKIWKTSKNRKHQLRLLEAEEWKLKKSFLSSTSYWRMSQAIGRIFTNDMLHRKLKLVDGLRLYVEKHEEAKEKDKDIIYFDFLAKRMADEEEGLELLKEDWHYYNIERYV